MPARLQRGRGPGNAHRAALVYLESLRDGDSITVRDAASRFGASRGAVSAAIKLLRDRAAEPAT